MSESPRFHIHNLGCRVNRVESDSIAAGLIAAGAQPAEPQDAALIIVNTCTVTAEADSKTRKSVRGLLKRAPQAQVICTGCSAVMNPSFYAALDPRISVIADKGSVLAASCELLGLDPPPVDAFSRVGTGFMARAGIKVQDGCDNDCSFCIVRKARGAARFRDRDSIIEEARAAHAAGVGELVLTGINLGTYPDLPGLIQDVLDATAGEPLLRLRFSSIEPQDVSESLLQVMAAAGPRVCHYLHMPLQSGSDRTLTEMNRHYSCADYERIVCTCREYLPDLALACDLMVGFPGESDADFAQSLAFCERMGFSRMHLFRYSMRPGTPAASRKDQVSAQVKAQRAEAMHGLASRMRHGDQTARVGMNEFLAVERVERQGSALIVKGTLGCFHEGLLTLEHGNLLPRVGALVPVRIVGLGDDILLCDCDSDTI